MESRFVVAAGAVFLVLTAGALAEGPAVALKAVGNYADPQKITVGTGDVIDIGLFTRAAVEQLASFQTDIVLTGPGAVASVVGGAWFTGGGASDARVLSSQANGTVRVLGHCFANPRAVDGTGDLAVLKVRFDGPGPVVLTAQGASTEMVDTAGELMGQPAGDSTVVIGREPCECYDGNTDRAIGYQDIGMFIAAYGSAAGDPQYVADYDANGDGQVNWMDFARFSACYGKNW